MTKAKINLYPRLLINIMIFLAVTPDIVHAYIDPGTGSYLFQLSLGAVLGGLYAIKLYWRKLRNVFQKRSPEDKNSNPNHGESVE